MSPRLPRLSGAEAVRALERAGFAVVSQRGSHRKLRHPDGRVVIVPMHRELASGTMASILRQAGLSPSELEELR
ncbi:MAG: type II toxin-antitoxin system HicA family toxin [Acidimicrobiales bacterium]